MNLNFFRHKTKTGEVQLKTLKNPILKIFPLNNEFTAAVFSLTPQGQYIYSINKIGKCCSRTTTHPSVSDYQPYVLANGFYFHQDENYFLPNEQSMRKRAMQLCNIEHAASFPIHESLEPSLAAVFSHSKENSQLLCVSKDRQQIYFYDVNKTTASVMSIYKTINESENISSIATFPWDKKKSVAIALNTGEIKLCEWKNNLLIKMTQLTKPNPNDFGAVKLLSSEQGFLIGYDADKNKLRIWDINHHGSFDYHCDRLYHLAISANGKYVTALQEGEQSNIFIIDLMQKEKHTIKLKRRITDFVIGYNDNVCIAQDNNLEYWGELKKFLNEHCHVVADNNTTNYKEPKQRSLLNICDTIFSHHKDKQRRLEENLEEKPHYRF